MGRRPQLVSTGSMQASTVLRSIPASECSKAFSCAPAELGEGESMEEGSGAMRGRRAMTKALMRATLSSGSRNSSSSDRSCQTSCLFRYSKRQRARHAAPLVHQPRAQHPLQHAHVHARTALMT